MSTQLWCMLGAAALTIACGFPVKVGNLDAQSEDTGAEGTFDPSDATTMGGSGDPPPPAERHDFAIRLRDIPEGDEAGMSDVASSADSGGGGDSSGSDTGGIGDPFDPDALLVVATLGSSTCEDPFAAEPECRSTWRVSFNLPPELQFAGATARLDQVNGTFSSTEPAGVDCSGAGGGTLEGELLITGIDETRISADLTELVGLDFGSDLRIDAQRCT